MTSNADATRNRVKACEYSNAKMIFYSTDYVFDGKKRTPYIETDIPNPQTVYGKSKLEAETSIIKSKGNNAILRIAWLYGANGKNFVKTILAAGFAQMKAKKEGKSVNPLKVVNDQIGNPTWTMEIVRQTEIIIENNLKGIFHCTAEGEASWYEFSKAIFDLMGLEIELTPCTTQEYPSAAARPQYSSLENKHLYNLDLNVMRNYKDAIAEFLTRHGSDLLCQISS